jgi:hypothetical protein
MAHENSVTVETAQTAMVENLSQIEDAEPTEAWRERRRCEKSRLSASEMVESGSEFEKRKAAAAIEWYMTWNNLSPPSLRQLAAKHGLANHMQLERQVLTLCKGKMHCSHIVQGEDVINFSALKWRIRTAVGLLLAVRAMQKMRNPDGQLDDVTVGNADLMQCARDQWEQAFSHGSRAGLNVQNFTLGTIFNDQAPRFTQEQLDIVDPTGQMTAQEQEEETVAVQNTRLTGR